MQLKRKKKCLVNVFLYIYFILKCLVTNSILLLQWGGRFLIYLVVFSVMGRGTGKKSENPDSNRILIRYTGLSGFMDLICT